MVYFKRKILHLDMDSYFASVEQQKRPELRGKPIGVSGKPGTRTVVAAASREAKPFGVKSGMATWEAKKLCPQIQFVPGNMRDYQKCTRTWLQIMRGFSPTLEIFSIDEAFLDITDTAERFGGPLKLAWQMKQKIREKMGAHITASIGIAHGKIFSKLLVTRVKPDGICVLKKEDLPTLLENTPPEKICGIGEKTAKKLEKMGINTLAELGKYPLENLKAAFGVRARELKLIGQGIDSAPVIPYWKKEREKSIGHSFTLPKEVATFEEAKPVLFRLTERVARKLRARKLLGGTISLNLRNLHFKTQTRQKSISYYTQDAREIFDTCLELYKKFPKTPRGKITHCSGGASHSAKASKDRCPASAKREGAPWGAATERGSGFEKIRLVGVRVSNLASETEIPQNMFKNRWKDLTESVDKLNQRYGETVVHAASLPANKILRPPVGYAQSKTEFNL